MEAKIFVIAFPTMETVAEKIGSLLEETFKPKRTKCCDSPKMVNKDLTPPKFRVNKPCGNVQPWGVCGTPADENLRFGAEFAVDEPRCENYDKRWQFESDHAAFDRFVEAGEDCVARGLEKKSNAPITKCNAVRKRLNEAPPMNLDLIGETHWWETFEDFDF